MTSAEKKRRIDALNEALNKKLDLAPTPEKVVNHFIKQIKFQDKYAWFEATKKGEKKTDMYCAACQTTSQVYAPVHNTYEICPNCKQSVLARRIERSRDYRVTNKLYIKFYDIVDGILVVRYFNLTRYYSDFNFKLDFEKELYEYDRIIFRAEGIRRYIKYPAWFATYDNYVSHWGRTAIPTENSEAIDIQTDEEINDLIAQTEFKRAGEACNNFLTKKSCGRQLTPAILYKFATWKCLEYLSKLGYIALVSEIIRGRTNEDKTVNLYEVKANSVLGVPHSILSKFDISKMKECDIKAIKQLIEYGRLGQLTQERLDFVSSILTSQSLDPLSVFKNFGLEKVINWLNRQAAIKVERDKKTIKRTKEKFKNSPSSLADRLVVDPISAKTVWYDFRDYRNECHQLGYDITDEGVMFPKDLYSAHERTSKLYREKQARDRLIAAEERKKLQEIRFKECVEKWGDEFRDDKNGLIMRVCGSPEELIAEGTALHHCVGTYTDRIGVKSCVIFFIRSAKEPDKSLYTAEFNPNSKAIVQIRGRTNSEANKTIYDFVKRSLKLQN
jgi:hypothetical protein